MSVVKETTTTDEPTEMWSSRQQPLSQGNCLKSANQPEYLTGPTPLGLATQSSLVSGVLPEQNISRGSLDGLLLVTQSFTNSTSHVTHLFSG